MRRGPSRIWIPLLLVVLLVATCGSSGEDDALAEVQAEFESWAALNDVPGAVLALTLGDESAELAYGVTDMAEGTPMATESTFRVGSITKTVTSAVILQLVDEGLVDLDAPVADHLPGWEEAASEAGAESVTVRQLLEHTAGFSDYAVDPAFYLESLPRLDVAIEPTEIVQFSLDEGLLFEPGTAYNYSTTNYIIAGLIIEAVTGNPAHEEFRTRIFEPLALEHLFLTPGEFPDDPVVTGYMDLRNGEAADGTAALASLLGMFTDLFPDEAIVEVDGGLLLDIGTLPQEFLSSVAWTGGGLEGRAADTVQLLPGYFNAGILSEESIAKLMTPSEHKNRSVGLTIDEGDGYTLYSHGGSVPGYRSGTAYAPELDFSVVVLTNSLPLATDVHELFARLAKLVAT